MPRRGREWRLRRSSLYWLPGPRERRTAAVPGRWARMRHGCRIGVALGWGAARGLAHIGVLKVLEQNRIPIDLVVGTSVGALIGGVYATTRIAAATERR